MRGPITVAYADRAVWIDRAREPGSIRIPFDEIDELIEKPSRFWTRLALRRLNGEEHALGPLSKRPAALLAAVLRDEARRVAIEQGVGVLARRAEVAQIVSGERFLRRSAAAALHAQIVAEPPLIPSALVRAQLPLEPALALERLAALATADGFERARTDANQRFVAKSAPAVRDAMETLLNVTPTDEQAAAIATDEDATLVLAGAGTGKTSVITGKVAHLVRNQRVPPAEILVLAYNREAANELRDRLGGEFAGVDVSTFHAFGRRVIGAATGRAPAIAKLAEDDHARNEAFTQIINDLIASRDDEDAIVEFAAFQNNDHHSPFDFEHPSDYYDYVRGIEHRTLAGELVKSDEELQIANFLALNGIAYQYESPYSVDTASPEHRRYEPDFYLPDYDVYIEHFALDEAWRAPPGWNNYTEGVEWKREIHRQHGTTLIETYSWQARRGLLREHLRHRLEAHGVAFRYVPLRDLLEDLGKRIVSWLARLCAGFLSLVKAAGLTLAELRTRAARSGEHRSFAFLNLFERAWARYEVRLETEGGLDFHDLINGAAEQIRAGRWSPPYRYVLVDEFQDISAGRMALLESLRRAGVAYLLVGDDWQSIYRFAGSDVGLLTQLGARLGHTQTCGLTQTFRYPESIAEPSAAFVRRNPQQSQRPLRARAGHEGDGWTIVAAADQANGARRALADINARCREGRSCSVLVLGRYRRSRQDAPRQPRDGGARLEYSTVHAAKGREADYVIVLDLNDDRYGFPSLIDDDPLLQLALSDADSMPLAEERRLFYVAITRARRGVYLIADSERPSRFVEELRRHHPQLRQLNQFATDQAPACPRCSGGRLVVSQTGRTRRCTNHPLCEYQAQRCEQCRGGYLIVDGGSARCSNNECGVDAERCPRCAIGVLRMRNGRNGRFWGCSEYYAVPPCRYTRDMRERSGGSSARPR